MTVRLYLSSFRVGDHPAQLLRMAPAPGPVALVANALDALSGERRSESLQVDVEQLVALGYRVEEVDLRVVAGSDLRDRLAAYPVVYARGGNVFVLREAMRRSGADRVLPELVCSGSLVYAGYSAGPCVLAPDLHGLQDCDPVSDVQVAYPGAETAYDGLGLLDRAVVPHLDSPGHPETDMLTAVAARYQESGRAFWPLRDGEVLLVDGERIEVLPRTHARPRSRHG